VLAPVEEKGGEGKKKGEKREDTRRDNRPQYGEEKGGGKRGKKRGKRVCHEGAVSLFPILSLPGRGKGGGGERGVGRKTPYLIASIFCVQKKERGRGESRKKGKGGRKGCKPINLQFWCLLPKKGGGKKGKKLKGGGNNLNNLKTNIFRLASPCVLEKGTEGEKKKKRHAHSSPPKPKKKKGEARWSIATP